MPRNGRLGLQAYARILAEITTTPKTPAQAAEAMGIGKQSMREILWRMEHMKLAHVVGWVEPELKRGFLAPLFAAVCSAAPVSIFDGGEHVVPETTAPTVSWRDAGEIEAKA